MSFQSEEITNNDLPKVMQYIQGCVNAYSFWKQKYKDKLSKGITPEELIKVQRNYEDVMNALTVCLKFIKQCKHILDNQRHALLFGIIYAGMQEVKTTNEVLIKEVEDYKKWYLGQFTLDYKLL
jgi:hypothetical protein